MESPTKASINKPTSDNTTADISKQYETPAPEPFISFNALKERIRHHYEICSDYYYSLWGEHIHHGYFTSPTDTKEQAQIKLIELLLGRSEIPIGASVLDVGCGIGGTSRFLARNCACDVTGITISGKQVEIARRLSGEDKADSELEKIKQPISIGDGGGTVHFLELDAEKMGEYFTSDPDNRATFDCIWISEAMSHLPNKELFFKNAELLLKKGGKLVVADWFKAEGLSAKQMDGDIKPIEDGMLLPPLCTQNDYVRLAKQAGLSTFAPPLDISKKVSKTWDISWSLIQNPSLWAFAITQGRDGLAFLQAFKAMRRGCANESFCYAVMTFRKTTV